MVSSTQTTSPGAISQPPTMEGGEVRVLLPNVGWHGYQQLLAQHQNCGPRMAYLDGSVEQMTTGPRHEGHKKILARMVEYLLMELGIANRSLGSTTFNRKGAARGVEPDECYYLSNAEQLNAYLTGPTRTSEDALIDLEVGPPPDLVLEVELSSPLLDKLAIYAGLGVPELWRSNGRRFRLLLLQPDGTYAESPTSRAFPFLPIEGFVHHLGQYDPARETQWARSYRTWVREVVAPLYQPG